MWENRQVLGWERPCHERPGGVGEAQVEVIIENGHGTSLSGCARTPSGRSTLLSILDTYNTAEDNGPPQPYIHVMSTEPDLQLHYGLNFGPNTKIPPTLHTDGSPYVTMVPVRTVLEVSASALAIICTGYDDLGQKFPYRPIADSLTSFLASCTPLEKLSAEKILTEAALDLSEVWVNESFRTSLAILGYVAAICITFVKLIDPFKLERDKCNSGGDPNWNQRIRPHSIAYAMSHSFVLCAVILSAAAGGFGNHRAVEKVLENIQKQIPNLDLPSWEVTEGKDETWLGALGMNYSFRAMKRIDIENKPHVESQLTGARGNSGARAFLRGHLASHLHQDDKAYLRTLAAFIPVFIALSSAFLISWFAPTDGLGCRSLHHLATLSLYIFSHLLTIIMQQLWSRDPEPADRVSLFTIIMVKDTVVAITQVTVLTLAFAGLFNRCWCWSAAMSLRNKAAVSVSAYLIIEKRLRTTWPAMVVVGLVMQFGWAAVVIVGRRKARVFKKTEEEATRDREKLRSLEVLLKAAALVEPR